MDLEAAVIRAEMSQTRHALDSKITRLEEKAKEMTPRRYWQRHRPEFLWDRTIGGALTLAGLAMAWKQYRRASNGHARPSASTYEEGPAYWGT
jgi:hypothetical protein